MPKGTTKLNDINQAAIVCATGSGASFDGDTGSTDVPGLTTHELILIIRTKPCFEEEGDIFLGGTLWGALVGAAFTPWAAATSVWPQVIAGGGLGAIAGAATYVDQS